MALDFDNRPVSRVSTVIGGADPRERVIRSAAYAPVASGRRDCGLATNQKIRYRDVLLGLACGDGA